MKTKLYRVVANFGYGDMTWLERLLHENEAIEAFNQIANSNVSTLQEAMYDDRCYYIEEDDPNDEEDWDWMDS